MIVQKIGKLTFEVEQKGYSYQFLDEFVHQYGKGIVNFTFPITEELRSRFGEVHDLYDVFDEILSGI